MKPHASACQEHVSDAGPAVRLSHAAGTARGRARPERPAIQGGGPPGRAPCLHVVNPATVALAEDIYTGRDGDGCWWYWWPWAEPIAPGTDPEAAAARIAHVLAVSG